MKRCEIQRTKRPFGAEHENAKQSVRHSVGVVTFNRTKMEQEHDVNGCQKMEEK